MGLAKILVGCMMIAGGIVAIACREQIAHASFEAQRRFFGEWIRRIQGDGAAGMLVAGIVAIIGGMRGVFVGIRDF